MENYIVSARKYRPSDFRSVVGQSHITTTLQNALKTNQLAQAFLFCGPRGVGKTTCARILAKTINCPNLTSELEACNECESCKSFNASAAFNVVELDAASNNSVDDIRALVDQVRIPPQAGKYKVYIIDEVHMLSTSAFNAFLKTLEEPPAYAKFILATTEKHKIIPTILSRCQIFDFHRIKNEDISNHLEYIAQKEGVIFEKEALHIISQKADGGLRDALSMFDQLVSFTRANLTYNNIIENLNILDYDYYFKFVDGLLKCDIANTLLLFNEVLEKGFEGLHFITGLANHTRNLLVCKDATTVQLLEASQNIQQKYLQQAANCSIVFLLRTLDFANTCAMEYRDSSNKRLCVEISLLKMANIMKKIQAPSPTSTPTNSQTVTPASNINNNTIPIDNTLSNNNIAKTKGTPSSATQDFKPPILKSTGIAIPKTSAFSINTSPDNTIAISEEKKNRLNPVSKPLVWQEFETAWNEFAENIKEDKPNLYFTLTNSEIVDNKNNTITLIVLNSVQEKEFDINKYDLMRFLKEKTLCTELLIETKVKQTEKKQILYQPREKFEFLAQKSPALLKLRAEFDMDVDY